MAPLDDIPQAARDLPLSPEGVTPLPWLRRTRLLRRMVGFALLALLAGSGVAWYQTARFSGSQFIKPFMAMVNPAGPRGGATTTDLDRAVDLVPSGRKLLLGHRAFEEAPADDLVGLAANSSIRLRSAAAAQYEAMAAAARREGIRLVPLSGFRSQAEQEKIFFNLKATRGQNAQARAEVSAPPGYSEHHTGYAIDVGDSNRSSTHLDNAFADTDAYTWMTANAVRYGYELSFPPNNFQGVTFEPWHWRFVGDRHSLETFYSQ
jgi:zinc D-Ala-D-Ala carboxypeptidase